VFPLFVLVVARGVTTLADPRVRVGVLVVVLGLGFVGGVRNVKTNRTEAGQVQVSGLFGSSVNDTTREIVKSRRPLSFCPPIWKQPNG